MGLAASCAGHCESDPQNRCESREDFFVASHERLGVSFAKKGPSGPLDLCEDPSASRLATVSPPGPCTWPADGFPRRLELASPNGCRHCEGTYALLPAADRPVWRRTGSATDRWLYLGASGRWYVDGSTSEEAGFACSSGFLRSPVAEGGRPSPLDMPCGWERGVDYRWHPDADVVIRKATALPDAQQILRSAEVQEETELSVEFMESCLDVQQIEEQPVHTAHLAFTSLADVRAELEKDDWIVNRFLREEIKATDIVSLPMETTRELAHDSEGVVTACRRTYFTMPVPQDNVPTIVSLLSGLPETTRVTAAFGFQARVSELTLVQWTAMHHVIFGENFRVRDTLSFRPHPDRGVEFRRWTEVVWVKDLPVLHEAFRSTLEERILIEGMRSAEAFSRILDSESRRRRIVAGERVTDKAARPERGIAAPAPHAEKAKAAFSLAIRRTQSEHVVAQP